MLNPGLRIEPGSGNLGIRKLRTVGAVVCRLAVQSLIGDKRRSQADAYPPQRLMKNQWDFIAAPRERFSVARDERQQCRRVSPAHESPMSETSGDGEGAP